MVEKRIAKVQENLQCGEALLITSPSNRFYFTGFHSTAGTVVITKDKAYFLIDFRYFEKAKSVVRALSVRLAQRTNGEIYELLKLHGTKTLYLETYKMSIRDLLGYKEAFSEIEVSTDSKIDKLIERLRSVKSEDEIARIKKAQEFTDKTFSYILERIEPGRTEKEIMLEMEFNMRKLGAEGASFDFIVVSGKNSSLPHGVPSDKKIEKGDFLTMDFGGIYEGYCSDMTRTVAVGSVSDEQKAVYDIVLKAQLSALDAVKAGKTCYEIDKVARDIISAAGYGDCFGHGLGHSLGIDIHEDPRFNTVCHDILLPGTVMTVEPGIYIENKFGVRIEDMVIATEDGHINLTKSDKKLIVI